MNEYNICNCADKDIFSKQCKAIEKKFGSEMEKTILTDVDGSEIVEYRIGDKLINVYNDYYIGAVYIKANFELEKYFE